MWYCGMIYLKSVIKSKYGESQTGLNQAYLHAEQYWRIAYEPVNRY